MCHKLQFFIQDEDSYYWKFIKNLNQIKETSGQPLKHSDFQNSNDYDCVQNQNTTTLQIRQNIL